VLATFDGETPTQTFVDVFPAASDAPAAAGSLRATIFEPDRNEDVILRVQPELQSNGTLRVVARAVPALHFPVANARPDALKSVFGDARDGGRRHHEGVDIFARRGTAVLSASHGIVTRVNETAIGGRVVWVWDPSRSLMLYYAHLDTQLVTAGQRVGRGDVIGTIGNTGNARTTAPHLHFGIYESGTGAIDPHTFIAG
jgi:peptidoglycan LD-endopeptidase LytH